MRGLSFFVRLIICVIQICQIIYQLELAGLFDAKRTCDTADIAHRARNFANFLIAAGNRKHIFLCIGNHIDEISRTGLRAGCAAGAFFVVNRSEAVDYMQGVKLARLYAIAESKTAEFAMLNICQRIRGGAGFDTMIVAIIILVVSICPAMNNRAINNISAANLNIKHSRYFIGAGRPAG